MGWDAAAAAGRGGVRSDDEMLLCSPSSAVAGALGKRLYRRITGSAEGTAAPPTVAAEAWDAARAAGTRPRGIRTPRCCRLSLKGRRGVRGAGWTPAPTPTPTPTPTLTPTYRLIPAEEGAPSGERGQSSPRDGGTVDQGTYGEGSQRW